MGPRKQTLVDYSLVPEVAIVDPVLTSSMPPNLTADTGVDALTHALEAAVSIFASPYTDAQGAQAAAGHIGGIGVQHLPHQIGILTQLRPAARVRHRGADHGVGVADQVFGACLDGNINAKIQRFEQDPRRPGVIDHDNRFRRDLTHGGDNRWHIMHFHGDGAGRFQEHHAGLRPNKLGNISAD